MLRPISAACLVSTALTIVPALAQNNNNTQEFVTKAAEGGMFEIQSSELALKKSQDQDIQQFARRMIADHTKADDKLKSLATKEKVPSGLDQEHQQMLSKLQGENGSNFAEQFKQMQVSAHQQAVDLFASYANDGSDQPIKQFAEQTLPTLREHLQMAQQITIASAEAGSQQVAQNAAATQQADGRTYLTQQAQGTWRASKMIGLGVYNEQNQKVGDINDVLLDRNGNAQGVVIGVGGFLGLGERNVAVAYDALTWSMEPTSMAARAGNPNGAATMPTPGLGGPASPVNPAPTGLGGPVNPAPTTGPGGLAGTTRARDQQPADPDHAILANASKDQLQKAPQFQYGGAAR